MADSSLIFRLIGKDELSPVIAGAFGGLAAAAKVTGVAAGGALVAGLAGSVVAAAAAGAAIAAAAGAAMAGLGLGIALAAQNQGVKDAASSLATDLKATLTDAAEPIVGPLINALGTLRGIIEPLGSAMGQVFAAVAPLIEPFAAALTQLVINALPGFVQLATAGVPVLQALIPLLPALGSGFSTVAGFIAQVVVGLPALWAAFNGEGVTSDGVVGGMERIGVALREAYDFMGRMVTRARELFSGALAQGSGILSTLSGIFTGTLMPALAQGSGMLSTLSGIFTGTLMPAILQQVATFEPLASAVGGLVMAVGSALLPILGQLGGFLLSQVLPAILALRQYLSEQLVPVFIAVIGVIQNNVLPIVAGLAGFFVGTLLPAVMGIVRVVAENLRPVFEAIVGVIIANVLPAIQQLLVKFEEYRPTIQRVIMIIVDVIGTVLRFASAILGAVLPPVIRFAGFLLSNLVPAIGWVIGIVIQVIAKVVEFAASIIRVTGEIIKFVAHLVLQFGRAASAVGEFVSDAVGRLRDIGSRFVSVGKDIISGIVSGIAGGASRLADAARDAAQGALKSVKKALGIHSPSLVFRKEVGHQMMAGAEGGVNDAAPSLAKTASDAMPSPGAIMAGRRGAAGGGGSASVVELRISAGSTDLDRLLLDVLRRAVRVRGGDVQVVLSGAN